MSTRRHDLLRVIDTDLSALTELDNRLRQDVPGTEGWQDTAAGVADSLRDDELDPDLYLVAVDRHTGSYDGIIRVWMRQAVPKLGFIGVVRPLRRTRLAAMLLGEVADRLARRGVQFIATSTDVTNAASHTMARRQGGIPKASAWSTSGDKRVQHRRRSMPSAVRRGRSRHWCRSGGCRNQPRPGFDQHVPLRLKGLDPLGFGAHRRARNPKYERLLLQTAGIGDHST